MSTIDWSLASAHAHWKEEIGQIFDQRIEGLGSRCFPKPGYACSMEVTMLSCTRPMLVNFRQIALDILEDRNDLLFRSPKDSGEFFNSSKTFLNQFPCSVSEKLFTNSVDFNLMGDACGFKLAK